MNIAPQSPVPNGPLPNPVTLPRKSVFERYRSPVNLGLYVMPFAVLLVNGPSDRLVFRVLECLGYLAVMVGTVGRIWCGIYIAGRKSKALSVQAGIRVLGGGPPDAGREEYVFGRKSRELCTNGPYSICRNPLYLFSFLCGIGVVAQADSLWALAVFGFVFWSYYLLVIQAEEKGLHSLFGEEFVLYCRRVPRLIPNFQTYRSREKVTILVRHYTPSLWKSIWPTLLAVALNMIRLVLEVVPSFRS